jgi:serine/threonine protein kinase
MLVFEFIPKGSLYNVLHASNDPYVLSLQEQLDIAVGSAEALSYMHSHGGHNHVHGDIKSGNIFLDDDFTPKVSDFGSAKLVCVASMYSKWCVSGDMSYIDPVYIKSGRFREKSDVYSFGVVLLELITRKKAKDGENSLPLDFIKCCKENNGRKLYDKDMLSNDRAQCGNHMECLDKVGALAVRCLKEDVDERPNMAEVLEELKQVKAIAS